MMSFKNSVLRSCLMLVSLICWFNAKSSGALGTFGFDIHHRYSDTVKKFLGVDGLPEKGSVDYYATMAHRDELFKGRRLAASTPILTFYGDAGNKTYKVNVLSRLHYSIVSVGTPALNFLVALDTGSDLFWLPCDCPTCARSFNITVGSPVPLNIYSPSNSTTSTPLPCNSAMCGPTRGCSASLNACSYQQVYGNTSTRGILVNDVLHMGTDVRPQDAVDVSVTFGCGKNQTGSYLNRGGMNGVFGLGMDSISVPSVLASKGLVANSFSMCFGPDGPGRIEFGYKGSADQKITPFNLQQSNPTYDITVTQVAVGNNVTDLEFTANIDSSITYSYFTDPAFSFIANNFNSRITETRYRFPSPFIFDYCYALSANQDSYITPKLTLTMKGGSQFNVTVPTVGITRADGGDGYCLAIIKGEDFNVIGHNFMTGYRLVFDREDMVLGWKESDCYDIISSNTPLPPPTKGNSTRSRPPLQSPQAPPPSPRTNDASSMTSGLVMVILAVFSHSLIILS